MWHQLTNEYSTSTMHACGNEDVLLRPDQYRYNMQRGEGYKYKQESPCQSLLSPWESIWTRRKGLLCRKWIARIQRERCG